MTSENVPDRIREIDRELAALRDELGERADYPMDAADMASELTRREEHSALIEALEGEKYRLEQKLADGG